MFDSDTTFLKKWGLRVLPNKLKLIKKEAVPQGAASSNFRKWVHITLYQRIERFLLFGSL